MLSSFLIILIQTMVLKAIAIPMPAKHNRRGPYQDEIMYLTHCAGNGEQGSVIGYYRYGDFGTSIPDSWYVVNSGNLVTWEGNLWSGSMSGNDDPGSVISFTVASNGASMQQDSLAGLAVNSFGQGWNCYKDVNNWRWNCNSSPIMNGQPVDCRSQYYCFDADKSDGKPYKRDVPLLGRSKQ